MINHTQLCSVSWKIGKSGTTLARRFTNRRVVKNSANNRTVEKNWGADERLQSDGGFSS